jgi:hypothetical protein
MTKVECAAILAEAIKQNYTGYSVTCELGNSCNYAEVYPAHVVMAMEQTGDIDLEFGLDIADHDGDTVANVTLESLILQT